MRAAIVIPAFNERSTLRDIATEALAVCSRVIVVDDGSTDGTAATLDGLSVELLVHAANRGKAAALWTGFEAALARDVDVVVTLDADGQHRPEDVPHMLLAAERFPGQIVIAARLLNREAAPPARRFANAVADFWLSWASGHPVSDSQSGQRAYPASLLRTLLAQAGMRHDAAASFTLESEILIVAGRRGAGTVAVPIDTLYPGSARPSYFRPARDISRIVRMVGRHLLASRLQPRGLYRVLTERSHVVSFDPVRTVAHPDPASEAV